MTSTNPRPRTTLWGPPTTLLLLLLGLALAVSSFVAVQAMGDAPWHNARDAELRATYGTYLETGALLIKPTGSGSYGAQAPADGPLSAATWDDDPGSYIIASLMGNVTGSDSPYPGLTFVQGLLIALPLVWLPLAIARMFRSPRAGYALIALPFVVWVLNHGAGFVGTEYGLADLRNTLEVYAIYGIAASMAFLSLSLVVLLSTYRLRLPALIGFSLLLVVLAGAGNLARGLSGVGVALSIGVLWWLNLEVGKRWRLGVAAIIALCAVGGASAVQNGVMAAINVQRAEATEQPLESLPDAHALWHSMYMGLSYPQALGGEASPFGVLWSDEFGWEEARAIDPDVVVASQEYDDILKDLYFEKVLADPFGAVVLYASKTLHLAGYFSPMLVFVGVGVALTLYRRGSQRRAVVAALVIGTPTLVLGLAPPILVMPMLYYYSEISAALGLLCAVALGGGVWALTTWPAAARKRERERLALRAGDQPTGPLPTAVSIVVVRETNEADGAIARIAAAASSGTEILVSDAVGGASAVAWPAHVRVVAVSDPADALRAGVSASTGDRVVAIADPANAEPEHVIAMAGASSSTVEYLPAAATKGASAASVVRGAVRRVLVRSLPRGDVEVLSGDGPWLRSFAGMSHLGGAKWPAEALFAAHESGLPTRRSAQARGVEGAETWSARDLVRLAWRRPEYSVSPVAGA